MMPMWWMCEWWRSRYSRPLWVSSLTLQNRPSYKPTLNCDPSSTWYSHVPSRSAENPGLSRDSWPTWNSAKVTPKKRGSNKPGTFLLLLNMSSVSSKLTDKLISPHLVSTVWRAHSMSPTPCLGISPLPKKISLTLRIYTTPAEPRYQVIKNELPQQRQQHAFLRASPGHRITPEWITKCRRGQATLQGRLNAPDNGVANPTSDKSITRRVKDV